jgi:hypothetical protein
MKVWKLQKEGQGKTHESKEVRESQEEGKYDDERNIRKEGRQTDGTGSCGRGATVLREHTGSGITEKCDGQNFENI